MIVHFFSLEVVNSIILSFASCNCVYMYKIYFYDCNDCLIYVPLVMSLFDVSP